jgi:hypothetical protein
VQQIDVRELVISGHGRQRKDARVTLKGFDEYARLQLAAKPDASDPAALARASCPWRDCAASVYIDAPGKAAFEWVSVFDKMAA